MTKDTPDRTRRMLLSVPLLAASSQLIAATKTFAPATDLLVPGRTLLLKNADVIVTMDSEKREIRNGSILIRDNKIAAVGKTEELTCPQF